MRIGTYRKEGDEFIFERRDETFLGTKIVWRGLEVAIGFTYHPEAELEAQCAVHRHGSPRSVGLWVERATRTVYLANLQGQFSGVWDNPHMISASNWSLGDLNQIISGTGNRLAELLRDLKVYPKIVGTDATVSPRYSSSSVVEERQDPIDHRGFDQVLGSLNQFPELEAIVEAILSQARHFQLPDGERLRTRVLGEGNPLAVDHAGLRYLEQNQGTGSPEALRAKDGAQIVWVIQTHDKASGLALPKHVWLGKIEDGIVRMK